VEAASRASISATSKPVEIERDIFEVGKFQAEQFLVPSSILDRLLHHSTTVNIRGESYRLKGTAQGGVVAGQGCGAAFRSPGLRSAQNAPARREQPELSQLFLWAVHMTKSCGSSKCYLEQIRRLSALDAARNPLG
jgi:hypothetical protein